jgi:hypothetical protein
MLEGEISVRSAVGRSSTFTLTLPIKWPGIIPQAEPFTKLCQNAPFFKTGMNGILEIPLPWREGLGEGESGKDLDPISAKLFLRRRTVEGLLKKNEH